MKLCVKPNEENESPPYTPLTNGLPFWAFTKVLDKFFVHHESLSSLLPRMVVAKWQNRKMG
jgi:hypothetical protein